MSQVRLTSEKRRQAILEAALKLFSEKGFRGATTRELAAVVGVSEPVLYQHFATKKDIYTAILEQLTSDEQGQAQHLRCCGGDASERDVLLAIANGMLDWHLSHVDYVRILIQSGLEGHEFGRMFYERYSKPYTEHLENYFSNLIDRGVFRPNDPRVLAQTLIAVVAAYALQLAVFSGVHELPPREQMLPHFIGIFLEGAKQRESQN